MQIKNQESCGSSWAFSATGALEGQLYKSTRNQISLSEQQLLDCSINYGNKGCSGGVATNAFMYVARSGGICRESAYPYLGYVSCSTGVIYIHILRYIKSPFKQVYYCADRHCSPAMSCAGFHILPSGSENALLDAVYNVGPIRLATKCTQLV